MMLVIAQYLQHVRSRLVYQPTEINTGPQRSVSIVEFVYS